MLFSLGFAFAVRREGLKYVLSTKSFSVDMMKVVIKLIVS